MSLLEAQHTVEFLRGKARTETNKTEEQYRNTSSVLKRERIDSKHAAQVWRKFGAIILFWAQVLP